MVTQNVGVCCVVWCVAQYSVFTWSVLVAMFTCKPPGSNHLHVQTLLSEHHPNLDVT